jgi:hypothetical protein
MGIFRDCPLKTRTSKQPIGKIPGLKIFPPIPSNTLVYFWLSPQVHTPNTKIYGKVKYMYKKTQNISTPKV